MYIRNLDDALENLAEVLDLPERRDQLLQSTVRIMLCLEVEPRLFLADCQVLLIEGGLDVLREQRRRSVGNPPLEEVASALDALHFAETVRLVFPGIRGDRWQIARALLLYEPGLREQLRAAVRKRRDEARQLEAREAVEGMIAALRPGWGDRLGAIRTACRETLKQIEALDPDRLHEEAELLFELIATSDPRALELLAALDGDAAQAREQIARLHGLASEARALQHDPPPPPDRIRDVA